MSMVDISHKEIVMREAKAIGKIILKKETIELIKKNAIEKGDVITIAKIAAIQAIKHTSEIIPLCHPIPIEHISIEFSIKENEIEVLSLVRTNAKTGVEMEALTGASVALLTIWDMVKKYEKDEKGQYPNTLIKEIRVIEKSKW